VDDTDLGGRLRRDLGLVRILAPREFRTRYRQSVLDVAWSLISPVVICAVYGIILTRSFDVDGACSPYLSSAWTGLVLWTFFATAVGTAGWSLVSSADLLGKVYFPREAIPLSVVGATLVDLAVGLVTVVVVVLAQGVDLRPIALTAFAGVAVLVVWAAALSLLFSVVAVFLRDVNHAVQLGLRVGFFATPVMYEASFLPEAFRWTATVSPVAAAIEGVRDPLLCGTSPDVLLLAAHLVVGLAVLALAVLYTRRVEDRMVDVI
jgi:lipopolysaccharide transport system permease protein